MSGGGHPSWAAALSFEGVVTRCRPAGQAAQRVACEALAYLPPLHTLQTAEAASCRSWYVPATHLSHAPLPASGWTVPGLHAVCSVLPVEAE